MTSAATDYWNLGDYQRIAFENVIISERLCDALAISAGTAVLDVACGTGNASLAAARRRARVAAVDIAPGMIERARQRATAEGLTIEFQTADAASLPFGPGKFDFVLSTFGAVFMPDQPATARELVRVVRPGGTIALTGWARQSLPSDVYRLVVGMLPQPAEAPPPAYTWTDGPRAAELFGPYCGSVVIRHQNVDACFASAEALYENHALYYGPIISGLKRFSDDEQRARFRASFIDIVNQYNRATDGTLIARYDYATIIALKSAG